MAVFSNKIISTKFIDPPNNMMIELLYREGDTVVPYVLEVDFTSEAFNSLLEEVTLDEIEKNTGAELKTEKAVFDSIIQQEIERRWGEEQVKVKLAYDKAEKYAQEVIDREFQKVSKQWEKIDQEYSKLEDVSKQINEEWNKLETAGRQVNQEWDKLETAGRQINEEWNKLEVAAKQVNQEWNKLETAGRQINEEWNKLETAGRQVNQEWDKIEVASKQVNQEWDKLNQDWKKIEREQFTIEKEYQKVDLYAEQEKTKKLFEVQEEFQKIRSDLQSKFNITPTSSTFGGKEVFALIEENNKDNDFVFNLKVSVLEDPVVSKSKDKQKKLAIRKAKTVLELMKIYAEMKETT